MLSVLVVEDTPAQRQRLVRHFTHTLTGDEVRAAESRDEALARLSERSPDLILLDLVIPAGPGDDRADSTHGEAVLELAKRLRPTTRAVVFSSERQPIRDFLREKGADDFSATDSPEAWAQERLPALDTCVGRLLCLLAAHPGERMAIRPCKRDLGLLEHEPAWRYVFVLRQLLDDTDFEGRNSRYVSSHYGEVYEFNPQSCFCLVRRLSRADE